MTNEWDITIKSIQSHWKSMAIGLFIGLIVAICILIFQKPVWQAKMIIAPTERTGIPNLSSFLPQTLNETPVFQYFVERLDASNASDFITFQTLMNGPEIADYILKNHDDLIADKTQPAYWLSRNVKIRPYGTTPYKKVTLNGTDRQKITSLLNILFQQTDSTIRQNALAKTNRRITYLREELKKTRHPDHRDAMIALLKEQERIAMTVSIDHHFAAVPIQYPVVSNKMIAPDWRLIIPVCLFIGLVFGLIASQIITALKR
jgi:LPS O-antigen subunit length determinant protein (WzzB/FepE family)